MDAYAHRNERETGVGYIGFGVDVFIGRKRTMCRGLIAASDKAGWQRRSGVLGGSPYAQRDSSPNDATTRVECSATQFATQREVNTLRSRLSWKDATIGA